MKKLVEMPEVTQCDVESCSYNVDRMCHARGITVGNMQQHLCDTMWTSNMRTKRREGAGVGACRSTDCIHNEDLECQADGISVSPSGETASCATFAA